MIIAYTISPHDDGTYMLGDETYRPSTSGGFHDWRFGKDGVAHSATCPTCGRRTDPTFINPEFKVKTRKWDISTTYDGYCLVSTRFRLFCEKQRWQGMTFASLPADNDFFVLRLANVLEFDAERRATRFENPCSTCRSFYNVIGATPVYLREINERIEEGFFRSDLEFGSGPEQCPLILLGVATARKLKEQKFQKYASDSVTK